MVAAWSRILRARPPPGCCCENRTLGDPSNRAALLARFARRGVAPDRLMLRRRQPSISTFLRGYDEVDIALDTFPYNGGTTTTEALWQGVPVLTFNGDRWASRTSRSLLLAAGLTEWVVADVTRVRRAQQSRWRGRRHAGDLARLRAGMRARLRASAACDTASLCRALEALYASENWSGIGRAGGMDQPRQG